MSQTQKCQALERKQQLRVSSLGITIVSKLNVFARLTRRRKTKNFKRAMTQVIQQNNLNNLVKQEQQYSGIQDPSDPEQKKNRVLA